MFSKLSGYSIDARAECRLKSWFCAYISRAVLVSKKGPRQATHTTSSYIHVCGWNTIVPSKLEDFATADSLTANLPILYRFSYLLLWEGHIFPSDSVAQPCPPCTQCRTSEQAVFRPAGAMTRSSSPSSQPLLACAVTHIDLGHVIHCLWPLLWRFLSLLHVLIIYVTINLVNWKLVTSRLNLVDKVVATYMYM